MTLLAAIFVRLGMVVKNSRNKIMANEGKRIVADIDPKAAVWIRYRVIREVGVMKSSTASGYRLHDTTSRDAHHRPGATAHRY